LLGEQQQLVIAVFDALLHAFALLAQLVCLNLQRGQSCLRTMQLLAQTFLYLYVRMHACMQVFVYVCMHVCTYVRM